MSEEELLEEIKRHIDYTNAMNEKSLRDLQIENLYNLLQQKENIIKEVRESAKRELKIAEENIKQSEKWLDIEEEQEHAKKDIHTGKVVKRYMKMFLEILDKENK